MTWAPRRPHKFGAVKVERDGRVFSSRLEAALYDLLKLMVRAGAFKNLKCQVTVRFHTYDHGKIVMIPDFSAIDAKTGETVYFEAKGFETNIWRKKKKAWKIAGPGPLYVYKGSHRYLKLVEKIVPIQTMLRDE
jgi:predicted nuclease of restriction endonuclease-like RecB superfamily